MTRFARGDGSKGSNQRTLEEATPWSEMVKQRQSKSKPSQPINTTNNEEVDSNSNQVTVATKKKKKKKKLNETINNESSITAEDVDSSVNNEKSSPKKRKKRHDSVTQTNEETDKKVKQSDTDGEQPNCNSEDDSKKSKSKWKKKDKSLVLEEKPEFKVNKKGLKVKVFRDGKERPYFDLPYEDGEQMTRFDGFWVKKEQFEILGKLQKTLEQDEPDAAKKMRLMMKAKRKAHKELRMELVYEQRDILRAQCPEEKDTVSTTDSKDKIKVKKTKTKTKKKSKFDKPIFKSKYVPRQSPYLENDYMTQYEGYWVRRASVAKLEAMKIIRHNQIVKQRTDGHPGELSEEEQILYQRSVKKEKRNEADKLRKDVKSGTYYLEDPEAPEEYEGYDSYRSTKMGLTVEESKMVKFDGFWVRKEGAERLSSLKEKLGTEGLTTVEVDQVIKKERRKEEKSLKSNNRVICFQCRQSGHMMSQCPNSGSGANSIPVVGICFKCGSTEHKAFDCKVKNKTEFAFASCFICGETGHISRSCPDNPKGLYPKGGSCKVCESVEHLAKDCPYSQEENQHYQIKLSTIDSNALEALDDQDDDNDERPSNKNVSSKPSKRIVF